MIGEYFIIAVRNLARRGLRSWLTILGVFIAVAAVVSLISITKGLEGYFNDEFERMGTGFIMILTGAGGMGSFGVSAGTLTERDAKVVERVRGVDRVMAMLSGTVTIEYGQEKYIGYLMGIDAKDMDFFFEGQGSELAGGRTLKPTDRSNIVIGYRIAEKIFAKPVPVRGSLVLEGHRFKVVGALKSKGNSNDDAQIFVNKDMVRELMDKPEEVSMMVAIVRPGLDPTKVAEDIKEELEDHRGQADFSVQTATQMINLVSGIMLAVQVLFIGVASIALVVGCIGIMNTMYTSVMERQREIGILKAVGARNGDILAIFLIESGLLGLVGGLLGVGVGLSFALVAQAAAQAGGFSLHLYITPGLIGTALGFSFLTGSMSGVLPAYQAAQLHPVESLRK
jgi:putative ABC transport system permease protein